MNEKDDFFDINKVLITVFSSLEKILNKKDIELIYDISATIPKELKGNGLLLSNLLSDVLTFVIENTQEKEILCSISAPEDFLYEELISFEINDSSFSKNDIVNFLENKLNKNLELLHAETVYDDDNPSSIHIKIPFKLNELGNRRYYRLPAMLMLNKKVLLLCKSQKTAQSIERMLKYFLYDVVVGITEYKKQGNDLSVYDIILVEEKFITEKFETLIRKVQETTSLNYVILRKTNNLEHVKTHVESVCMIKPIMQESIYDLIVLLFNNKNVNYNIRNVISMEKYIHQSMKNEALTDKVGFENKIDKNISKESKKNILNFEIGEKNANKYGLAYSEALHKFIESFDGSDKYLRKIVNDKQTWQIKEFCIDLEKHSKDIGAKSMNSLANEISLLFVYNKLDMLPVYINKYHEELRELMIEIKKYLHY